MDLNRLHLMAVQQMEKYGLAGWTFRISQAKRQLGVCKYASKRIEISEFYARNNPEASVLDTLLHEIAHALAGDAAGHGPIWKAMAVRVGAKPETCDKSLDTVVHPGDWQAKCPGCLKVYQRYKRPLSLTGYRCRCPARAKLVFEYQGDPAFQPYVPETPAQRAANWVAKCAGCEMVHRRVRRPKAGIWRCRCPQRCVLQWKWAHG